MLFTRPRESYGVVAAALCLVAALRAARAGEAGSAMLVVPRRGGFGAGRADLAERNYG